MSKQQKKRRRRFTISMVIFLFFLFLGIVIYFFGQQYADQALRDLISENIPEPYSVQYQKLNFDIWDKKLEITELRFSLDSLALTKIPGRMVEIQVPGLEISLESIASIYFDKTLIIEGISILDPSIEFQDFSENKKPRVISESVSLFKIITQYLNLLEIDFFNIESANLSYTKDIKFALEDLDFKLGNLIIDSTLRKRNFFNAEYVELIARRDTFQLADDIHQLSFDQLRISTQDSILSFENIRMHPRKDTKQELPSASKDRVIYDLSLPEFNLRGIDYVSSYLNRDLKVRKIEIKEPNIHVNNLNAPKTNKDKVQQDAVVSVLDNFSPLIDIGQIEVKEGQIVLDDLLSDGRAVALKLDYLDLYHFRFKPDSIQFSPGSLPIKDFRIGIRDFNRLLPDGKHEAIIETIQLSSIDSSLGVKNLEINPLSPLPDRSRIKFSIYVPDISISNINYLDFLAQKKLQLDDIQLIRPITKLILPIEKPSKKPGSDLLSLFNQQVKQFFLKKLQSNKIDILEGKISVGEILSTDRFDISLQNMAIHPRFTSWNDLATSLSLNVAGLQFRDGEIEAKVGNFKTNASDHTFEEVDLSFSNKQLSLKHYSPRIRVYNFGIDSFLKKRFIIDSILTEKAYTILQLQKTGEKQEQNQDKEPLALKVGNFIFSNNKMDIRLPSGGSLSLGQVDARLNVDSMLNLKALSLQEIQLASVKNLKRLSIDRLERAGPDESFLIDQIKATFDTTSDIRQLSIPQVRLTSLNRDRLLDNKEIELHSLEVSRPVIVLEQNGKKAKKSQEKKLFQAPPILADIISIDHASFQFTNVAGKDTTSITIPVFDLDVRNMDGINFQGEIKDITDLFQFFHLQTKAPVEIRSPAFAIGIQDIDLSSEQDKLELKEVDFSNEQVKLWLDSLSLAGIDPDQIISGESFTARDLFLNSLNIDLQIKESEKKNTDKKKVKIGIPIALDRFQLKRADLNLTTSQKEKIDIEDIHFLLEDLRMDTLINLESLDQNFGTLDLRIDKIALVFGKYKEYNFSQGLHYDSREQRLTASDIRISPIYSPAVYSEIINNQTDHFNIKAEKLIIHRVLLGAFFTPDLHLQHAELLNAEVDIFHDRNISKLDKPTGLVQTQIRSIKSPFLIDSLEISGRVKFSELAVNKVKPGFIEFNQLNGSLLNITNLDEHTSNPMILKANGKLYDEGDLSVVVHFDLQDSLDGFDLSAKLGRFDLTNINKLVTPLKKVQVSRGTNKSLIFNISANNNVAIGDMYFRYNKLRFQLLNKQDPTKVSFGNSLVSFFANSLVRSNNPSFLSKQKGIIYFKRDKNKAIFNYWVKSILSGLISSMGVRNNKKRLKHMTQEELDALHYKTIFGDGIKLKKPQSADKK